MLTRRLLFLLALVGAGAAPTRAQTAGNCTGPSASSDLDIGGVRARLYNNGGLFWKGAGNVYNVPKNPLPQFAYPSAVFAQSIWIGGFVGTELRQAAAMYGNWEFYAGPLGPDAQVPGGDCRAYDRIYNVSVRDVRAFEQTGQATRDLLDWPVALGAPVLDGDGVPGNYNLFGGDRPDILGHQTAFWVMNDAGGPHLRTGSKPLGLEVRVTAHAFRSTSDALYYATVYRYTLINRGARPITETYFGGFADPDLGNASDDYVGSDTTLRLAYVYNADNFDEGSDGYGTAPPALGWKILDGPPVHDDNRDGRPETPGLTSFNFFNSGLANNSSPEHNSDHHYKFMTGRWKDGRHFYACGDGHAPSFASCGFTRWMFSGDPTAPAGQRFWSEFEPTRDARFSNAPSDRRFAMGSGPFTLQPNVPVTITLAMIWARGSSHLDSVTRMKAAAREVQAIYDATGFRNLPLRPDPPAPAVAPQPVGPADAIEGQPARPLVSWEPVPGATFYEVAYRPLGAEEAADTLVAAQGLSARLPIAAAGRYVWRVRAVNEGGRGPFSAPFSFGVGLPALSGTGVFENFLTTRNAAGPLDPPEYAAFAFNSSGFPHPTTGDRPVGSRQQSTGNLPASTGWGIHTFGNHITYDAWVDRVTRAGGNLVIIGSDDFEWRFTGASLAWRAFGDPGPAHIQVPFELWSTGTQPGPEDDVRMIPLLCENTCGAGGTSGVFDIGGDSPLSGGPDDPISDAVYWYYPRDRRPGDGGYQAWAAAAAQNVGDAGALVGDEALARVVLMGWNMGANPATYRMRLPEPGTVFRIVTTDRPVVVLSAPRNGVTSPTPDVRLAWQEPEARVGRRYVEVATDNDFRNVVRLDSSATEPYVVLASLPGGVRYYWRVRLRLNPSFSGAGTLTPWSDTGVFSTPLGTGTAAPAAPPEVLTLRALYPSPARTGAVTLRYGTPEAGAVRIRVFDVLGREAARVFEGTLPAGWHAAAVDAGALAPGLYVVRVEAGARAVTRALVVAR
jgi:hypothetical protein